jgi:DNA-binding GntR family transcriptional regulator
MHQSSPSKRGSETPESQKVPFLLVKSIREAILDEVFQPGDRLVEVELAEKFEVSRSPWLLFFTLAFRSFESCAKSIAF